MTLFKMATNLPMVSSVLGATVGLQSVSLLGVAARPVLKGGLFDFPKKGKKMKPMKYHTKNMLNSGVGLLVGIPLVGATAGMVNNI